MSWMASCMRCLSRAIHDGKLSISSKGMMAKRVSRVRARSGTGEAASAHARIKGLSPCPALESRMLVYPAIPVPGGTKIADDSDKGPCPGTRFAVFLTHQCKRVGKSKVSKSESTREATEQCFAPQSLFPLTADQ